MIDPNTHISDLTVAGLTKVIWHAFATAPKDGGKGDTITQQQACDLTGVSERTFRRMRRAGELTTFDAAGKRRPNGSRGTVYLSLHEMDEVGLLNERTIANRLEAVPP